MSELKLTKNSKNINFPNRSGNVKATFERAVVKSKEQKWTKVIIIGEGRQGGHWFHSTMGTHTVTGMLDDAKYLMNKDFYG